MQKPIKTQKGQFGRIDKIHLTFCRAEVVVDYFGSNLY